MSLIVQKYGGSSVATPEKIKHVAELVVARKRGGDRLVVVVSAMGDTTDELLTLAKSITQSPPRRELDMLVTCGERISMALLAMAIATCGEQAISLTGSQSGIITDDNHFAAKIIEVRPHRIEEALARDAIVIVAGYQGMSAGREITTLGRGGSDTTAVALAAALRAEACEIYSDVDGVYTADPRIIPDATRLAAMSYDEMQAFAAAGAKVLNADAVAFAKQAGIAIHARKTGAPAHLETVVTAEARRTSAVCGVAVKSDVCLIEGPRERLGVALEALQRRRAHLELLTAGPQELSGFIDLENVPDHSALTRALQALTLSVRPAEVVSLIGQRLARDAALVGAAAARVPVGAPFYVTVERICAVVPAGQGTALANAWHAAFVHQATPV